MADHVCAGFGPFCHSARSCCSSADAGRTARVRVRSSTRPAARDRTAASFPAASEDYFHDMDGGVGLTPEEIQGRNTWLVWTGGNDRFWDAHHRRQLRRARPAEDRLVPSRQAMRAQPRQPLELPRPRQRALLRASRPAPTRSASACGSTSARADCPPDPFENEQKYPGVRDRRARQERARRLLLRLRRPGIVGLRLFPNPDFDEAAAKKWDPVRYYTDPSYYDSTRTWCGPTASACRARSATWARTR